MTNINYWKEIYKDIANILNDLNGVVLLTHNSIEFIDLIDFLNKIKPEQSTKILYISFVRSYGYMKNALFQKPLNKKDISFIDCVSGYAFPEEENVDECLYHKPPRNLEEMKQIIQYGTSKTSPDIVIIDSLSQFINFSKPTEKELFELYQFLGDLKNETTDNKQTVFILLYDTKLTIMQNLPKTYIDLILKIEITKDKKEEETIMKL